MPQKSSKHKPPRHQIWMANKATCSMHEHVPEARWHPGPSLDGGFCREKNHMSVLALRMHFSAAQACKYSSCSSAVHGQSGQHYAAVCIQDIFQEEEAEKTTRWSLQLWSKTALAEAPAYCMGLWYELDFSKATPLALTPQERGKRRMSPFKDAEQGQPKKTRGQT